MSLFACDQCDTVDSTELAEPMNHPAYIPTSPKMLCTNCQGFGWHNQFPKEIYDPLKDAGKVINRTSGIGMG